MRLERKLLVTACVWGNESERTCKDGNSRKVEVRDLAFFLDDLWLRRHKDKCQNGNRRRDQGTKPEYP